MLFIAIIAILTVAVFMFAARPRIAFAQAVEDMKVDAESPSQDDFAADYEIEDLTQEKEPPVSAQPEDIKTLQRNKRPKTQITEAGPAPPKRPAAEAEIKERQVEKAGEPPEDLLPDAEPPGTDKLKRSAKKPVEMKVEPAAVAEKETAPAATGASGTMQSSATGAVTTSSIAGAATETAIAASATSSAVAGASPSVNISQLPPGAVVVDNTTAQPAKKTRDVVPFGTVELVKRNYSATGNNAAFLSQNGLLYFNDKFEQNVMLGISGKLDNGMKINGEFRDRQYLDKVFHISVAGKNGFGDIGDTQAQFVAGEMTGFTKSIRGVSAGYTAGNTSVRALMSNVKSKTQGESFNGRNIRGPYPLSSNDIMEDTEVVRVNGRVVSRSEYIMDYFLGQISFVRVMDPSDRIEVNYESRLWVASKTGDMRGLSVTTKLLKSRADMGFAYLTESTEDSNAAKIYSSTASATKQNLVDSAPAGALSLGYTKLEKNREIVTASYGTATVYLARADDYSIDYPAGVAYFSTTTVKFKGFSSDTIFTVSFNYYKQADLQWVQNEELSGDGQLEFRLQYESVYGGTEVVSLYENGALIRNLAAGRDYQIVEGNNSIVFLDSNVMPSQSYGRAARISYEVVPLNVRAASYAAGERKVMSVFGGASLGKTRVGAEFARTESLVRLKEAPVVEEVVATVTGAGDKAFLLDNEAIPDSVEIYFDDPSAPSSRMRAGADYVAERDAASGKTKLTFKNTIATGTTILANYRYRIEPDSGVMSAVKGDAARVKADAMAGPFALKGEFMKKSPFFAPLTAYNDLESDRLLASASAWQDKRVSFNFDLARHNSYRNLNDMSKIRFYQYTGKIAYKARKNVAAAYTFERRSRADDLAVSLTDNKSDSNRFDISYTMKNVFTSALTFEKRGYRDATGVAADRDATRYGASINYAPKENIRLDLALDSSSLLSTPQSGAPEFTISNVSTRVGAVYLPDKNMSLNIKLDKQNILDSRDEQKHSRLDSINADLFGRTDSLISDYLISFYRQDRPDLIYGDSRTDIATFRATVRAASQVVFIPSYVITKSAIGVVTSSGDNTLGLRAEYRGGAKLGWRAAAAYTSSNRAGASASGASPGAVVYTDAKQTQTSLTVDYLPNAAFSVTGAYQTTGVKSESALPQKRNSYSATLNYFMNEITTLRLLYNHEKPPEPAGSLSTLEFNAKRKIDKNLDFGLDYKRQKQEGAAAAGYTGKLITMKLLASF